MKSPIFPFLFLLCLLLARTALAMPPAALLICNSDYPGDPAMDYSKVVLKRLDTPANDGPALKRVLLAQPVPWDVTLLENKTVAEMREAVPAWTARQRGNPTVLIYFSVHGLRVGEKNYLTGIDSNLDYQDLEKTLRSDLKHEDQRAELNLALAELKLKTAKKQMLKLDDVLTAVAGISAEPDHTKAILLDCCNVPFPETQLPPGVGKGLSDPNSRGLAPVAEEFIKPGMFLGYAAAPNQEAQQNDPLRILQGAKLQSLMTEKLVQAMEQGGSLQDVWGRTTLQVILASREFAKKDKRLKEQTPANSGVYSGSLRFGVVPMPPPPPPPPGKIRPGTYAGEPLDLELAPGVSLRFRWCPAGSFTMGSPQSEKDLIIKSGREASFCSDEVPHLVTLTQGFWLAETELTQGAWKAIHGKSATLAKQALKLLQDDTIYDLTVGKKTLRDLYGVPKDFSPEKLCGVVDDFYPMYFINHGECSDWCDRATAQLAVSGWRVVLPTEAQWEYAARAGTTTMTYAGDFAIVGENNAPGLDPIAWYGGNSSQDYSGTGFSTANWKEKQYLGGNAGPRRVGDSSKNENPWHLRDMIGNVLEWCSDWYGNYDAGKASDPLGASHGVNRVRRGGSWFIGAAYCRSANRDWNAPGVRFDYLGFRPALVPTVRQP